MRKKGQKQNLINYYLISLQISISTLKKLLKVLQVQERSHIGEKANVQYMTWTLMGKYRHLAAAPLQLQYDYNVNQNIGIKKTESVFRSIGALHLSHVPIIPCCVVYL